VRQAARKDVTRAERTLEKLAARESSLHEAMADAATDHARLAELTAELRALQAEREAAEAAWLAASELLEG
jgi:ATP-binding cassette subfamily F protein uup